MHDDRSRRDPYWLNQIMELDHVIRVYPGGMIDGNPRKRHPASPYAPEAVIETRHDGQILDADEAAWCEMIRAQGWEPERGWTGQYSYSGPIMHASEFVGGSLADHIADTPGLWVAVVVNCLRDDPGPDDVVTCVYCGAEIQSQDGDIWVAAGSEALPEDIQRNCLESADHLHAPEFDGEDEEPAGWAVLHMDDGPETESYAVKVTASEVTRESISKHGRMDLATARKVTALTRPSWPSARIVRVTDLAVMPTVATEAEIRDARIEELEAEQDVALRAGTIDTWEATGKGNELDALRETREAAGLPDGS